MSNPADIRKQQPLLTLVINHQPQAACEQAEMNLSPTIRLTSWEASRWLRKY